ncbi:family 20 glycosylhydrolase [Planococcus sp. SSTMD024]|uniref:family 20 glycosylhydrolase n=1 Tax=Planococcus sp. SSTMD024 TaxID=3242163 RepID=UPI00351E7DFC
MQNRIIKKLFNLSKHLHGEAAQSRLISGIILDTSRRHVSVPFLMRIIDEIQAGGGNYLQLHFSDAEGYRLYSEILGQTLMETNDQYLIKSEILELITYANDRDVMIIPDFDVPSHSKGWLSLVKEKFGEKFYNSIVSDFDEGLVDYFDNSQATKFVKYLIEEIAFLFKQDKYKGHQVFSIGGDEVPGTNNFQEEYVRFINTISSYVEQCGYKPRIWNDSLNEAGLYALNSNVEIVYWQEGMLPPEVFISHKRALHNSNFYTLVYSPSNDNLNIEAITEQIEYVKASHKSDIFCYKDNPYGEVDTQGVLKGTAYTFWTERGVELTDEQLLNQILPLVKNYLKISQS